MCPGLALAGAHFQGEAGECQALAGALEMQAGPAGRAARLSVSPAEALSSCLGPYTPLTQRPCPQLWHSGLRTGHPQEPGPWGAWWAGRASGGSSLGDSGSGSPSGSLHPEGPSVLPTVRQAVF